MGLIFVVIFVALLYAIFDEVKEIRKILQNNKN